MSNFLERSQKENALAKAADKSTVRVVKTTDAEFETLGLAAEAANTLVYFARILRKDCVLRAVIIGSCKPADDTKNGLKRFAVIGRDVNTNATLRGWITKFDDNVIIPNVGDPHKLPAFHLERGMSMVSWSGDLIIAKTDEVFQAVGDLQAETLTAEGLHYEMLAQQLQVAAESANVPVGPE